MPHAYTYIRGYKMKKYAQLNVLITGLTISITAQGALYDRGGGLIYDDVLNSTWIQNVLHAQTSGAVSDGLMDWNQANTWAANLVYYDSKRHVFYDDWRLPMVRPVNGIAYDYSYSYDGSTDEGFNIADPASELSYMYYLNLGNIGAVTTQGDQSGCNDCLVNTGPFTSLQSATYWATTLGQTGELVYAGVFDFADGYQHASNQWLWYGRAIPWVVRNGDVSAVPEPSRKAMYLLGTLITCTIVWRSRAKVQQRLVPLKMPELPGTFIKTTMG